MVSEIEDVLRPIIGKDKDLAKLLSATIRGSAGDLAKSSTGAIKQITKEAEDIIKGMSVDQTRILRKVPKEQREQIVDRVRQNRQAVKATIDEKQLALKEAKKEQAIWKKLWAERVRESRQRSFEANIKRGQFKGNFFPAHVAESMNRFYGNKANSWAKMVQDVAAVPRTMTTGFDVGVGFIHLMPLVYKHPKAWARAMYYQYAGILKDPDAYIKYVTREDNKPYIDELARYGLDIVRPASEMVEAMSKGIISKEGGLIHRGASKIGAGGIVTRFEQGFNGALGVGQLEQYKALRHLAVDPKTGKLIPSRLQELTAYIGKSTGVIDTARIGLPSTQKALESGFAFFAPRYFRAGVALWVDLFKGGIAGSQARRALSQLAAGGAATYVGIRLAHGDKHEDIIRGLDPTNSTEFMTMKYGSINVGIGSFQIAMMKAIATTMTSINDDDKSFASLSSRDNPLVRFVRGRVSLTTAAAWDIFEGSTFIGEPLEGGIWSEDTFREEVLNRATPFWLSQFAVDENDPRPGMDSMIFATHGLRTWAIQHYQKRDELREEYAEAEYGKKWDDTDKLEQKQLEETYSDLRLWTEKAQLQYDERATGDWAIIRDWRIAGEKAKARRAETLREGAMGVEMGLSSKSQYRQLIKSSGQELSGAYKAREDDPRFENIQDIFDKMSKDGEQSEQILDLAYEQYIDAVFNNDAISDAYGMFDFNAYNKAVNQFKGRWGLGTYNRVYELIHFDDNWPPLAVEFLRVKEQTKEYWDIADDVIAEFTNRIGFGNIDALKQTWQKRENELLHQLSAQNIPLDRWSQIIKQEKQRLAPQLIMIDDQTSVRRRAWKMNPANREAAEYLNEWYQF